MKTFFQTSLKTLENQNLHVIPFNVKQIQISQYHCILINLIVSILGTSKLGPWYTMGYSPDVD